MKRIQRGFTLLELLISLALVGLMVVLLFGALRFGSRAWDAGDARLERDTTITLLWQYLSDRFREARALRGGVPSSGSTHFFFQGEPGGVEFVAPMPAHLGSGGLYIIRLREVRRNGKRQLLLRRWLFHPEVLAGEAGLPQWRPLHESGPYGGGEEKPGLRAWYSESVLAADLEEVRFDYFGPENPGDRSAVWRESWLDKLQLPRLVRLRVKDRQGSWPEMVFELPAT